MEQFSVLMSEHTSMKVGGPARFFIEPASEAELVEKVREFHGDGLPFFILGNGTNVIVRDRGYFGAVISTLKALTGISVSSGSGDAHKTALYCGAGESLARISRVAAESGLTGLEELSGIPGSVGGAVYMNAGAYEREIAGVVLSVKAYDIVDDKIIMLTKDECMFGYRSSVFKKMPLVVLGAEFGLASGEREEIYAMMADFAGKRNEKQPVELPSAGSFFKRPEGGYAGRLIEAAGLKGMRKGGAQVSEKHAGFIVNTGGATASDVLNLAEEIKMIVYAKFRVELEEEPVIIGY